MPVAPVRTLVQTACAKDTAISRIEIIKSVDLPVSSGNDSIDFARDSEIYRQTQAEKGSKRWQQAAFDARQSDQIKMQEHGLKRPLA